jgi:hypothetical protein
MNPALRVLAPGLMTTLQDLGRPGYQHLGIPVSGALDRISLCAANAIVGNPPGVGALEIAYQGPTLAVEADSVRLAFAGGPVVVEVLPDHGAASGERVPLLSSVRLRRGEVLRIGHGVTLQSYEITGMKGEQYKRYYASLPDYVIGAYSFISSADDPAFKSEVWAGSEIPGIVGGAP